MATQSQMMRQLQQHGDILQERVIKVRMLGQVLQFLYSFTDDLTPMGSLEALELHQLQSLLSRATDTCTRIIDANNEYYLQDLEVIRNLEAAGGAPVEVDNERL